MLWQLWCLAFLKFPDWAHSGLHFCIFEVCFAQFVFFRRTLRVFRTCIGPRRLLCWVIQSWFCAILVWFEPSSSHQEYRNSMHFFQKHSKHHCLSPIYYMIFNIAPKHAHNCSTIAFLRQPWNFGFSLQLQACWKFVQHIFSQFCCIFRTIDFSPPFGVNNFLQSLYVGVI